MRLRFPLSSADQANIDPNSITVSDLPSGPAPLSAHPYPQSLLLGFALAAGAPSPQIRPLFAGSLRFLADPPGDGLVLPRWQDVDITRFGSWVTTGRLVVQLDPRAYPNLVALAGGLEVCPDTIVYERVQLTPEFLFGSVGDQGLSPGLRREPVVIVEESGMRLIEPSAGQWWQHAIARFLAAEYQPRLAEGATPAADDAVRCAMPTLATAGGSRLVISMALAGGEFQDIQNISLLDPAVLRSTHHGCVPARLGLMALRGQLLDAAPGTPIPDRILQGDWKKQFTPLKFRRSWCAAPAEFSYHMARQVAKIEDAAGQVVLHQLIPAHGVLYCIHGESEPAPDPLRVTISGDMVWSLGGPDAWKQPFGTAPVNVSAAAPTTVLLRQRMDDACCAEPWLETGGNCTYRTLRRAGRAWVDNRIAGGRLNKQPSQTDEATRALIRQAIGVVHGRDGIELVANGRPPASPADPEGDEPADPPVPPDPDHPLILKQSYRYLQWLLQDHLFPEAVTPTVTWGSVVNAIWLSSCESFQGEPKFPDLRGDQYTPHLGRGAPGALNYLGRAESTTFCDAGRVAGDAGKAGYIERLVAQFLTIKWLRPGAMLQWWEYEQDFEDVRTRNVSKKYPGAKDGGLKSFYGMGHSLMFVRYATESDIPVDDAQHAAWRALGHDWLPGIWIADQFGLHHCPVKSYLALETALAAPLAAGATVRRVSLKEPSSAPRAVRWGDELRIKSGDSTLTVTCRDTAELPAAIAVDAVAAPAAFPVDAAVTRSAFRTLTWSFKSEASFTKWVARTSGTRQLRDIDIWIAANWSE